MGPSESVISCYFNPPFSISNLFGCLLCKRSSYLLGELNYSSVCFSSKGCFKIVTIFELGEMVLLKNNNKCSLDTLQIEHVHFKSFYDRELVWCLKLQ